MFGHHFHSLRFLGPFYFDVIVWSGYLPSVKLAESSSFFCIIDAKFPALLSGASLLPIRVWAVVVGFKAEA